MSHCPMKSILSKFTIYVLILYFSSHSTSYHLGTHDIIAITIISATSSQLCIRFDLVEGWAIETAYIYLICDDLTINISCFSIALNSTLSNTVHKCFSGISVCTGKVLICGEESWPRCVANPAAVAIVNVISNSMLATESPIIAIVITCGVGGAVVITIIVVFITVLGTYIHNNLCHLPYMVANRVQAQMCNPVCSHTQIYPVVYYPHPRGRRVQYFVCVCVCVCVCVTTKLLFKLNYHKI